MEKLMKDVRSSPWHYENNEVFGCVSSGQLFGGNVMKMLCLTAIKGDKYQPGKYHEHEKREGPATIFTQ